MNASAATADDVPSPHGGMAAIDDPVEAGRFTRWVAGPAGQQFGESSLQLSGMWCAACAGTIEHALASVDGVETPVLRANVMFRAVAIPEGAHTVRFRFQPFRGLAARFSDLAAR